MVKKKIIKKRYGIESGMFYKHVSGRRQKYVKIVIKKRNQKTVTKQYRWRGGNLNLYKREALLPKGTQYHIDYRKGRIITSPQLIQSLNKRVTKLRKTGRKLKKRVTKKKVYEKLRIIPKKVRHPPKPIQAEKVIKLLDGKVYYEREHSYKDFITPEQEKKFLLGILSKATKRKGYAKNLLRNFDKIKLKMSYIVEIHGIDKDKREQVIGNYTAIGKRPREIVNDLKEMGIDVGEVLEYRTKLKIENKGYTSVNVSDGNYQVSDIRLMVKFYNNPQKKL